MSKKTFMEVANDPIFAGIVGDSIVRLSGGRHDFGVIVIIASDEGLSMLNSILDRETLRQVLHDALKKAENPTADLRIVAPKPS